jgi:predicted RNA-binding Zn-ribbon protein involved in translation (DUF1610 family)
MATALFTTICTGCGAEMRVPDHYRGRRIGCTACRIEFTALMPEERPFEFPCPACRENIEAEPGWTGICAPCPHCGENVTIPNSDGSFPASEDPACSVAPVQTAMRDPAAPVRCPRCSSAQVSANKKGFGGKGAVIGAVLLGPVGLLGGLMGSGKVKITCLKCGNEFSPGESA